MKNIFVALLLLIAANASAQTDNGTIKIKTARTSPDPEKTLSSHKAKDIEVVHTAQDYMVIFYIPDNGKLRAHVAIYKTKDRFDSCHFEWKDNHSVQVKLFGADQNKEVNMILTGDGGQTSMQEL